MIRDQICVMLCRRRRRGAAGGPEGIGLLSPSGEILRRAWIQSGKDIRAKKLPPPTLNKFVNCVSYYTYYPTYAVPDQNVSMHDLDVNFLRTFANSAPWSLSLFDFLHRQISLSVSMHWKENEGTLPTFLCFCFVGYLVLNDGLEEFFVVYRKYSFVCSFYRIVSC